jgi:hypothetical protein
MVVSSNLSEPYNLYWPWARHQTPTLPFTLGSHSQFLVELFFRNSLKISILEAVFLSLRYVSASEKCQAFDFLYSLLIFVLIYLTGLLQEWSHVGAYGRSHWSSGPCRQGNACWCVWQKPLVVWSLQAGKWQDYLGKICVFLASVLEKNDDIKPELQSNNSFTVKVRKRARSRQRPKTSVKKFEGHGRSHP